MRLRFVEQDSSPIGANSGSAGTGAGSGGGAAIPKDMIDETIVQNYQYVSATTNVHPVLSALVNYCHPVKFQHFKSSEGMSRLYLLCTSGVSSK